jgi:hypothetical protein
MMAAAVYVLCTLTSALCAVLLLREHARTPSRLLLWSGLSFGVMVVSNALVFFDLIVWPTGDLSLLRAASMCLAAALLVFGLVWDAD